MRAGIENRQLHCLMVTQGEDVVNVFPEQCCLNIQIEGRKELKPNFQIRQLTYIKVMNNFQCTCLNSRCLLHSHVTSGVLLLFFQQWMVIHAAGNADKAFFYQSRLLGDTPLGSIYDNLGLQKVG